MRRFIVAGMIVGAPIALYAQSASNDVLTALLSEVRQLRIALENAATTTPRIQVLSSRLTVQNDRVSRVARDLEGVRGELSKLTLESAAIAGRVQELEASLARESDPTNRRSSMIDLGELKKQADNLAANEQRLRSQESELANAYATELGAWNELNRRLDEVERELAPRRQP